MSYFFVSLYPLIHTRSPLLSVAMVASAPREFDCAILPCPSHARSRCLLAEVPAAPRSPAGGRLAVPDVLVRYFIRRRKHALHNAVPRRQGRQVVRSFCCRCSVSRGPTSPIPPASLPSTVSPHAAHRVRSAGPVPPTAPTRSPLRRRRHRHQLALIVTVAPLSRTQTCTAKRHAPMATTARARSRANRAGLR